MYVLSGMQSIVIKMNFQLKMLTHQLDECKYRFRAFGGSFVKIQSGIYVLLKIISCSSRSYLVSNIPSCCSSVRLCFCEYGFLYPNRQQRRRARL